MSETSVWFENSPLHIAYKSTSAEKSLITPRLTFYFELQQGAIKLNQSNISPSLAGSIANYFSNFTGELRLVSSKSSDFIGHLIASNPLVTLYSDNRNVIGLSLVIDPHILSQIEKIRESNEIQLTADIRFVGQINVKPQSQSPISAQIRFTIPKSDWIEKILPDLGFKTVSLIEVPQLIDSEFSDTIDYLNGAWKQYSMGEYRKVFADCRNAIECLGEKIKNKGFEKQDTSNGENKLVPDWEKFFGNKELGEVIATLNKKVYRYTSSGIHGASTRQIDREDADFAIMTTHAIVNLVVRKSEQP